MAFMFVECNIIMCCMEDQHGLFRTKQMIITLEEKYILESLIKFDVTSCMDALSPDDTFPLMQIHRLV